ncbi:hypothetical protein CH354_03895 [Leptospira levettii]|nr:hypothetical protein CH354_03895 [Leptospira levettii]PKA01712.1 hypothetical protein CH369_00465 [Leptospira levettii]
MGYFRPIEKRFVVQSLMQSILIAFVFALGIFFSGLGMNPFAYYGLVAFLPILIGLIFLYLLSTISIRFWFAAFDSTYVCSFALILYWLGNVFFSNSIFPSHLQWTCGIFMVYAIVIRLKKTDTNKTIPNHKRSWISTAILGLVILLFSFLPQISW